MAKEYDVIIGADIGLVGALSIFQKGNDIPVIIPMPVKEVLRNKKKKKTYDLDALALIVKPFIGKKVLIVQEFVSARPFESPVATFSLGKSSAYFPSICPVLDFDCIEIHPSIWKKAFPLLESSEVIKIRKEIKDLSKDKMSKVANKSLITKLKKLLKDSSKTATRELAMKMYPSLKDKFKFKKSDGLADSLYIAIYAKDFIAKKED